MYGLSYGMSPHSLAKLIGVDLEEAREYKARLQTLYPELVWDRLPKSNAIHHCL